MEEGSESREWDELIPDALGLIFTKLPLEDKLTVIPRVCKAWGKAIQGPYCWQEIDIQNWCTENKPEKLDQMLRLLISWSSSSVRKLNVSCVNNDEIFSFIADNAGSLESLIIRRSEISDTIVVQLASKFSRVTSLDLSYCSRISTPALEALGNNCTLLSSFNWNMPPLGPGFKDSHAKEARAIARTMPNLKHLELAYLRLNTESVLEILSGCPKLVYLDLRGCWDVRLEKKFLEERYSKLEILGPQVIMGGFETRGFSDDFFSDLVFSDYDYMDYSDDDSFDGMWDDEDIEVRIYEGVDNMYEFGWPPSP